MAHDGAGQCTSDCRRVGCPDDDESEEEQLTQEHIDNCAGCPLCQQ